MYAGGGGGSFTLGQGGGVTKVSPLLGGGQKSLWVSNADLTALPPPPSYINEHSLNNCGKPKFKAK